MGGPSLKADIVIISIILAVIDIVVVALRFFSRKLTRTKYGWDDWLCLGALVGSITLSVLQVVNVKIGNLGGHTIWIDLKPVDEKAWIDFQKLEFAVQVASIPPLTCAKLSILLLYRNILKKDWIRYACNFLIAVTIVWGLVFFFMLLFECYPISQVWTTVYGQPGRHCYNYRITFYVQAISNLVLDVIILALPQPVVWSLKMPVKSRLGVSFIFLLGALVCGVSITRIVEFFGNKNNLDATYSYASTLYWTQVEVAVTVMCICLPILRPVGLYIIGRRQKNSVSGSRSKDDVSSMSSLQRDLNTTGQQAPYLNDIGGRVTTRVSAGDLLDMDELTTQMSLTSDEIGVKTEMSNTHEKSGSRKYYPEDRKYYV